MACCVWLSSMTLSTFILTVFTWASLVPLRLNNFSIERKRSHPIDASVPSRSYASVQNEMGLALKQNTGTDIRRLLVKLESGQGRRQMLMARFRLDSGSLPTAHPSQPYLVKIDEETGAYVVTVEYGHAGHPLSRLANVRGPRDVEREAVFFFVLPKAYGGTIKTIMTNCYNLRRTEKREDPESLKMVGGVVNIDTQTRHGLAKARSSSIIDSGLVDVVATSYFFEGTLLFKPEHKGRAFTIFRHPVHRAEILYRSQRKELLGTIWSFLGSPDYIDNWVVRSLTNDKTGTLSEDHLMVARGILAGKFLVGIAEHLEETIKRLEIYYEWNQTKEGCVNSYLKSEHAKEEEFTIERGSYEWQLIAEKDKFDLMLYFYALELFAKQGSTMFKRPYVDKTGKPIDFNQLKKKREAEKNKN